MQSHSTVYRYRQLVSVCCCLWHTRRTPNNTYVHQLMFSTQRTTDVIRLKLRVTTATYGWLSIHQDLQPNKK